MILLLACAGDDAKPADTPDETAGETAHTATDTEESALESVDSPDDTAPDTDTGTEPAAPWEPGDPVPGWEDADCTEPDGGRVMSTHFPDLLLVEARFVAHQPGPGPHELLVRLRDCVAFPCVDDDLDRTFPFAEAVLAQTGTAPDPRGQGWWGPDATTDRAIEGSGNGPLQGWSNFDHGTPVSVTACLERVRPDEVRGWIRAEMDIDDVAGLYVAYYPYSPVRFYESVIFRFPFSVRLDDHAGYDESLPDQPADQPPGFATARFLYQQPYEDAWPWEDISDPETLARIQDRYTPYNTK